jgi:diketogulonate reductase-like aldo/keto reductase
MSPRVGNEDRKSTRPRCASGDIVSDRPSVLPVVGKAATSNPKVPREELFLTTKIMSYSPGDTVETLLPSLQDSVRKMHPGQEKPYVDLFLIHTPTMGPDGRLTLWKALIELQKLGQAKNIGVSNL